jgi:glycosyltransferase involved in cell wall biosynthesis
MSHRPCVSVGMAVYNAERHLEETLRSILAQTFSDFEIILADNASTDRTGEIALTYAAQDARVRYVRNPHNLGIAHNYNRTIALARGEYFKLADYDDLLAPQFLARCVAVLDADPDCVVCYTRAHLMDREGVLLGNYDPQPDTSSTHPSVRFANLILRPHLAVQCMGLMRRDVIRQTAQHGSYPSSDEVFLAEMALRGRFYEISERLITVRLHGQQTTQGPYQSQRARVVLFDTSLAGKIVLPKWRYLTAALWAVHRAPLSVPQRVACYGAIARWTLIPAHTRALGKDLLLAARQWLQTRATRQVFLDPRQAG